MRRRQALAWVGSWTVVAAAEDNPVAMGLLASADEVLQ